MTKTLTEKRFFHWVEDDISVTLRNKSGSYGGGSEVLVICSTKTKSERCVQQEQVEQGKSVICVKNESGGAKSIRILSTDESGRHGIQRREKRSGGRGNEPRLSERSADRR